MQSDLQGAMLLVDGAYLTLGSREIEKRTGRSLRLNEVGLRVLIQYIEKKAGVSFHPELKHFVTAEKDEQNVLKRRSYYDEL